MQTHRFHRKLGGESRTSGTYFGHRCYRPQVSGSFVPGDRMALSLSLVGVGGEICDNLAVDGLRPAQPAFTITEPDGEFVETGSFEYGGGFASWYLWRVPSEFEEKYRVKVQMQAGPFQVDPD